MIGLGALVRYGQRRLGLGDTDGEVGGPIAAHTDSDGRHVFLSTDCLHGHHGYCADHLTRTGTKVVARCRYCDARCVCGCHEQ